MVIGQSDLGNESVAVPSSQVTLDCVNLAIETNQHVPSEADSLRKDLQ